MRNYRLFLDDERMIEDCKEFFGPMYDRSVDDWVICRKSAEALDTVREKGLPTFMALDHDLGTDLNDYTIDNTMKFLHALVELVGIETPPPEYSVHSMNPVGRLNIVSFMESWKKVAHAKNSKTN